jgi:hypothetical protein
MPLDPTPRTEMRLLTILFGVLFGIVGFVFVAAIGGVTFLALLVGVFAAIAVGALHYFIWGRSLVQQVPVRRVYDPRTGQPTTEPPRRP